jgi:EAL domain-containing protein (putative c-di-GMP-specific phosphodiesterase class I)
MDGVEFLQALNAGKYSGSVILLSGEGARIMHTVQKLLSGGRLTILGALEKPAQPESLRALLDCWVPLNGAPAAALTDSLVTAAEVHEANRLSQWTLHYQPKVSLFTGALTGMEALVRWNHPQHGLVYPDSFISLAEDCGAIDALTDWVLRESIDQLARWTVEGMPIHIAVNVSMDNLRAPDFAQRVGSMVRDAGVSPQDVTLEITESQAMSPSPVPLETLVRLRLQRFKLSIDDFGTGYSSIAYLKRLPVDELKIDKSFVMSMVEDLDDAKIVRSTIDLAHNLGLTVVAEGVENAKVWDALRELDCDEAQGYHMGKPMPAGEFCAWSAAWMARHRSHATSAAALMLH